MTSFKKMFLAVAASGLILFSGLSTYAQGIGVVDVDKVLNNYQKAEDVSADLKVKEADLQKFLADAQKQLKSATSPVDKKNLETKLSQEFKAKSDSFKEAQVQQWKQIEQNIFSAIDQVSQSKKLDIVLNKSSVLTGGADITDQVLSILNAPTPAAPAKK